MFEQFVKALWAARFVRPRFGEGESSGFPAENCQPAQMPIDIAGIYSGSFACRHSPVAAGKLLLPLRQLRYVAGGDSLPALDCWPLVTRAQREKFESFTGTVTNLRRQRGN
jgi:hypothetical protein